MTYTSFGTFLVWPSPVPPSRGRLFLGQAPDMFWPVKGAWFHFFLRQCAGSRTDGIPTVDQSDIRGLATGMTTDWSGSCLALEVRVSPSLDAYIGSWRVLPPWSVLLPTHCDFTEGPEALASGPGTAWPIAQMKPINSRAMAVQVFTLSLPRPSRVRNRAHRRAWAFQAISCTASGARLARCCK